MNIRLIILNWVIIVLGIVYWNYYIIEKRKKTPKHGLHTIYRIVIALIYAALVDKFTLDFFIFESLSFFFLFNPLLNIVRNKDMFHTGLEDKESDSLTDILLDWLFNTIPPIFVWWCLFVLTLTSTYEVIVGWATFKLMLKGLYFYN